MEVLTLTDEETLTGINFDLLSLNSFFSLKLPNISKSPRRFLLGLNILLSELVAVTYKLHIFTCST